MAGIEIVKQLNCLIVDKIKSEDVKAIRKAYNMTQIEFAKIVGFSLSSVRNWEQGVKPPAFLFKNFDENYKNYMKAYSKTQTSKEESKEDRSHVVSVA